MQPQKTVYSINPATGEYVGTTLAQADPVALNRARSDAHAAIARPAQEAYAAAMKEAQDAAAAVEPSSWLLPDNTVEVEPPEPREGFARVFAEGGWQYVEDHCGATVWPTAGGESIVVTSLGPVPEGYTLQARPDFASWNDDSQSWLIDESARMAAQMEAMRIVMTSAVQTHLDAQARAMGYDDLRTAVTYADEPSVPRFQAEGRALRAWRSAVWAYCYALLDQVVAGTVAVPTLEDLIAGLPTFETPA